MAQMIGKERMYNIAKWVFTDVPKIEECSDIFLNNREIIKWHKELHDGDMEWFVEKIDNIICLYNHYYAEEERTVIGTTTVKKYFILQKEDVPMEIHLSFEGKRHIIGV